MQARPLTWAAVPKSASYTSARLTFSQRPCAYFVIFFVPQRAHTDFVGLIHCFNAGSFPGQDPRVSSRCVWVSPSPGRWLSGDFETAVSGVTGTRGRVWGACPNVATPLYPQAPRWPLSTGETGSPERTLLLSDFTCLSSPHSPPEDKDKFAEKKREVM